MFCQDCGNKTTDGDCRCGRSRSNERRKDQLPPNLDSQGSAIVAALNSSLGSKIDMVDSKLSSLSSKVEEVDKKVDHVNIRVDKHDERFTKLDKAFQAMTDFSEQLKALETKLAENEAAERHASVRGGASSAGKVHQASVLPKEERTIARMGNLGWDLDKAEVVKRAKQVLEEAEICNETYQDVVAVHRKGSMVEIEFHTPTELRRAHFAVEMLDREFQKDRKVWLSVAKTEAELRPGRIYRRLNLSLQELESQQAGDHVEVAGVSKSFEVKIDSRVGAFVSKLGEVFFKQPATQRYSKADLDLIKAWAESS